MTLMKLYEELQRLERESLELYSDSEEQEHWYWNGYIDALVEAKQAIAREMEHRNDDHTGRRKANLRLCK